MRYYRYYVWYDRAGDEPIIVKAEDAKQNKFMFRKYFPKLGRSAGGGHSFCFGDTMEEAWLLSKCKGDAYEVPFISDSGLWMRGRAPNKPKLVENNQARAAAWGKEGYVAREGAPFEFL